MRFPVVLAVLLFLQTPLFAKDEKWFEMSSEHFLLLTDAGEAKGRRLLADFENRVAAFGLALGRVPARPHPIEVFLFNNEADYIEALPRELGEERLTRNGYLVRGPDRVFIVAKDKSPDDIANDVGHQLGHVLFERYVMWRPFWLAEGAAEYVRKIGRSPDTKEISEQEGFSASDILTIVPSSAYNDYERPTAFRIQSYRLLRVFLDDKPDLLKSYFQLLRMEAESVPKLDIDADALDVRLKSHVETALKPPPVTAAMKSVEADPVRLAIHRGDLLLAAGRASDASRLYTADSKEARAGRAIVTRFTRPLAEAIRVLDRAARELPDNALVQYHFGAIDTQDAKDIASQAAALDRAIQAAPLFGRAYGELARVYALGGQTDKAFLMIKRAIELEPEYADRFYEIRADIRVAAGQLDEAFREINIAAELPHADRSTLERFGVKISGVRRKIESARRDIAARELDALRREVRAEADRRDPPPKPAPVPPPAPTGSINYEIETRAPIEVVAAVYPEYPEPLRKKGVAGRIALQVEIGPDGNVKTAAIANSQAPDLNTSTIEAVKKWTFKPGNRSIRLIMTFSLQ